MVDKNFLNNFTKDEITEKIEITIMEDMEDYFEFYQKPLKVSIMKRPIRWLKGYGLTMSQFCRKMNKKGLLKLVISNKMTRYIMPLDDYNKLDREKLLDLINEPKIFYNGHYNNKVETKEETKKETKEKIPNDNFFNKPNF